MVKFYKNLSNKNKKRKKVKELKHRFSTGAFTNLSSSYIPISKGIVFATTKIKIYITIVFATVFFASPLLVPVSVLAESSVPVYEWSRYFETIAGSGAQVSDLETHTDGSSYVLGYYSGTVEFNPSGVSDQKTGQGGFLTKFDVAGVYQWTSFIDATSSFFYGGFPEDSFEIDTAGNAYFHGLFRTSAEFDPVGGDFITSVGISDKFVTKINSDGSYGWTYTLGTAAGAPLGTTIAGITLGSDGALYYSGDYSNTTDFDRAGAGDVRSTVTPGERDAYLTRINPDGSYGWTRTFGGDDSDFVDMNMILAAGDDSGVYTFVMFRSATLDVAGQATISQVGVVDSLSETAALLKFDSSGNLLWSGAFGNDNNMLHTQIATDDSGALYSQGLYNGTIDFDHTAGTDAITATSGSAFLHKANSDGSYGWTKVLDTNMLNYGLEVTTEGVYTYGSASASVDWDVNKPDTPVMITATSEPNNYLTKWSLDGTYQWTRGQISPEYEVGYELAVNATCDAVYELGEIYPSATMSVPLDPNGSDNRTIPDTGAFYMKRYSTFGEYSWSHVIDSATDFFYVTRSDVGANDTILFGGDIQGPSVNFDPDGTGDILPITDATAFVTKLSNTNYRQHVRNLNGAVGAVETGSGDNAKQGNIGVARTSSTNIQIDDVAESLAVAQIGTDLSCDRDWTGVTAESNSVSGQSYVSGLTSADGTDSILDLYVPTLTDSVGVGVCPGATSLAVIDNTCGGYYELSSGDPGLTTTTIGGEDYWAVLGVTDGGAFNITQASPPVAPPTTTDTPDTPSLVDTGASAMYYVAFGSSMLVLAYLLQKKSTQLLYRFMVQRY